jgi:membrane associated rhomboid family serine protease
MPVWEEADEPSGRSTPGSGHPAPGVLAGGQSGQSNRCYRHPDRDAFVSCQRCGRPICPDCMRPAAVGFHCPEEAAAARTPAPPTQFGGRADRSSGLITKILIGICLVAYVLEGVPGLTGTSHVNQFTLDYSLIGVDIAQKHEYWRLVTAAFLHGSVLHIAFNMYALFLLGTQLEAILGRARYLALFFACAIGGNTLSYVIHGDQAFSYGASTAIFGFFAAYYLIARRLRVNTNQILIVVGINLLITFSISGIDKWGHIGGLATGVVLGLLYAYVPARRVAIQALGTAAVLAILIAAAVLNSQSLTALHTF